MNRNAVDENSWKKGLSSVKQITESQNCSVGNRTCMGLIMTTKTVNNSTKTDQGISVPTSIYFINRTQINIRKSETKFVL